MPITKSKSDAPNHQTTLLRRGQRLARTLQQEGRQAEAQTVAAMLGRLPAATPQEDAAANIWLTTGAVAKRVGVSRQTVVNWVNKGILPGRRVGGRTLIASDALTRFAHLEAILDDLDAERPPATSEEAAASVAQSRRGWSWQDPDA